MVDLTKCNDITLVVKYKDSLDELIYAIRFTRKEIKQWFYDSKSEEELRG